MTAIHHTATARPDASEHRIALGDISVGFTRAGSGPAVVLVHGLAEGRHSWDGVLSHLAPNNRCYAMDLRGHGETSAGQAEGTPGQLAQDLIAFLEGVSGPAICVGFSLGGVIVLEAALRRPDLIRKAVVIGTSSKVGRAAAQFFAARTDLLVADPERFKAELTKDTAAQLFHAHDRIEEVAAGRIAVVGSGAGYINAARAMVAFADAPLTERLADLKVPAHIIHGCNDVFCPEKAAQMLRAAIPTAGYSEIRDAGHLMSVDQPRAYAEAIAEAIVVHPGQGA